MSKNYNQISSQVAVVQTRDRTLAFYPKIAGVPIERFNELIEGKVKVFLKDFTAGKGDLATNVYYNLELQDVYFLYHHAKIFHMPVPFIGMKIIGATTEAEGRYAGMSPDFHISISRTDQKLDKKTGQMVPAKQPWNITIENGYGVASRGANPGTYYEKAHSFIAVKSAYINLSDSDFLMCMESVYKCIETYRILYGFQLIPKGIKELGDVDRRNSYAGQEQAPDNSSAQQAETQSQDAPAQQQTQEQTADETPAYHQMQMVILSDFVALEGGRAAAECMIKGRKYNVIFESITDDIIDAKTSQRLVTGNLYADKSNQLYCACLVAA